MSLDLLVRLFVLVVYGFTCGACVARVVKTHEERALVGNLAFASVCAGGAYAMAVRLVSTPVNDSTWVLFGGCFVCIAYLVTLVRKGL